MMAAAAAAPTAANACTFPTAVTGSMEQTAWQLFVAANCPTNKNQVVWENWIEQSSFYPAGAKLEAVKGKRIVNVRYGFAQPATAETEVLILECEDGSLLGIEPVSNFSQLARDGTAPLPDALNLSFSLTPVPKLRPYGPAATSEDLI